MVQDPQLPLELNSRQKPRYPTRADGGRFPSRLTMNLVGLAVHGSCGAALVHKKRHATEWLLLVAL